MNHKKKDGEEDLQDDEKKEQREELKEKDTKDVEEDEGNWKGDDWANKKGTEESK